MLDSLEMPRGQRLEFFAKYSAPDTAAQLLEVVPKWQRAADIIFLAEHLRSYLRYLTSKATSDEPIDETPPGTLEQGSVESSASAPKKPKSNKTRAKSASAGREPTILEVLRAKPPAKLFVSPVDNPMKDWRVVQQLRELDAWIEYDGVRDEFLDRWMHDNFLPTLHTGGSAPSEEEKAAEVANVRATVAAEWAGAIKRKQVCVP